jgi:hypothetical protein
LNAAFGAELNNLIGETSSLLLESDASEELESLSVLELLSSLGWPLSSLELLVSDELPAVLELLAATLELLLAAALELLAAALELLALLELLAAALELLLAAALELLGLLEELLSCVKLVQLGFALATMPFQPLSSYLFIVPVLVNT